MGGPQSLKEALQVFPDLALSDMRGAHLFKDLLRTIKEGVHVHSDFSGLDMFMMVNHTLSGALKNAGEDVGIGVHHIYGCDNWPWATAVLQKYPEPPKYLFRDVCERWPASVVHQLSLACDEVGGDHGLAKHQKGEMLVQKMAAILQKAVDDGVELAAICMLSGAEVKFSDFNKDELAALKCAIAGLQCLEFSTYGTQTFLGGKTTLTFMCWLFERKIMQEDFICIEQVEAFKPYMVVIMRYLPEYDMHSVLLSPSMFGFPAQRRRVYFCLTLKSKITLDLGGNTFAEAFHMFERDVALDGDAIFCAPDEDVAAHQAQSKRKRSAAEALSENPLDAEIGIPHARRLECFIRAEEMKRDTAKKKNLTKQDSASSAASSQEEEGRAVVHTDHARIVCIEQTEFKGRPSVLMPCLLCRSAVYSYRMKRIAIPMEHFITQGLTVYESLESPNSRCPLRQYLASLPPTVQKRLAGNTMHKLCAGIFWVRVLSMIRKRPSDMSEICIGEDSE